MKEKEKLEEEKKKFWEKYKDFYDKIPLNCKICKQFLEDDYFLKKNKVPYSCGLDEKADFNEYCDEFKLGKWCLVEILKDLFERIQELERLIIKKN